MKAPSWVYEGKRLVPPSAQASTRGGPQPPSGWCGAITRFACFGESPAWSEYATSAPAGDQSGLVPLALMVAIFAPVAESYSASRLPLVAASRVSSGANAPKPFWVEICVVSRGIGGGARVTS